MRLGESFATLHFPPGILPRGKLQIELQNLEFCASTDATHKHFAEDEKIDYPTAGLEPFAPTITITRPAPQPLKYAPRRSMFKQRLEDIAPPAPEDDEGQLEAQQALEARLFEPPMHDENVVAFIEDNDSTEAEFDAFFQQLKRVRRAEVGEAAAAAAAANGIGVFFATSLFLKSAVVEPPPSITPAMTMQALVNLMNAQLEDCKKQTGYLYGQNPIFELTSLKASEVETFQLSADEATQFKMLQAHVPYGTAIVTGGASIWNSLGFTEATIFTSIKDKPSKMLKNVADTEDVQIFRAKVPFRLATPVQDQYAFVQKNKKKSQIWPEAEKIISTSVNIFQNKLNFDIDMSSFTLPAQLHRDVEYTRVLIRMLLSYIRECFHYSEHEFVSCMVIDDSPTSRGLILRGFDAMPASSKFRFDLKIAFTNIEFAQQWGFSNMVIDYKGKPGPQKLPHTLFTEAPSVFDDMNEDDSQQAQASLSKALSNVINVKDWVGARDKTIPTFFEALIAANQPAANIDPDIGIFVPGGGAQAAADLLAQADVDRDIQLQFAQIEQQRRDLEAAVAAAAAAAAAGAAAPAPLAAVETITIPNPKVAPATNFIPWSRPPIGRCTAPGQFPDHYIVLLQDSEINDFIVRYGHVCNWAQKMGNGGLSSRKVSLINTEFERLLHIQILSSDLNLYIHKAPANAAGVDAYLRAFINVKVLNTIR